MKIHWVLGPRRAKKTGVGLFSELLVDALCSRDFTVKPYYFEGQIRSLRRYIDQYLVTPVRLLLTVRRGDLVILYQEDVIFLALVARLRTRHVLAIVHHLPSLVVGARWIDKMKSAIVRVNLFAIRLTQRVICPSLTTAQNVMARGAAVSVSVVENAFRFPARILDRDVAKDALSRAIGRKLDGKFVILTVGSEETRKNIAVLIDGMASSARRDEILFLKLGRPISQSNRDIHERKLKVLEIDHVMIDEVSEDVLSLAYAAADLFISPSLLEGFGRTPIEAQGAGAPVCASALEVFGETMGATYFPVSNPEVPASWSQAIDRLMSDHALRIELAHKGAMNAKRYDIAYVGDRFAKLIADIADE